jgi:short-subunit dehydrogenase
MILKNKTILITGASSGIGYELAKQFAREGCNLVLLARRKDVLEKLAQEIKSDSCSVFYYQCDIRNKKEVQDVFFHLREKSVNIDVSILNSGVGYKSPVEEFDSVKADETFQVNVLGMIYCIEEFLKDFLPRKNGMIVGVSSIAESRGFPGNGFYCASKAAVSTLLESIRVELKNHNIKAINVRPGFVSTPMVSKNKFKMPFLMDAAKAASIIISGIKKEKKIIEFPIGTVIGGYIIKLLPNIFFDFIFSKQLREKK